MNVEWTPVAAERPVPVTIRHGPELSHRAAPQHPPNPADLAQSRRFAHILRHEYADLQAQLGSIRAYAPRCDDSEQAARLRAQIVEVSDLLGALEKRFSAGNPAARGAA